jgi:hypothetical protein
MRTHFAPLQLQSTRRPLAVLGVAILVAMLAAPAAAAGEEVYSAALSGASAVPPVTTTATGTVRLDVPLPATQIRYEVRYAGLTSEVDSIQIRFGAAGRNGQTMFNLDVGPSAVTGVLRTSDFMPSSQVATWAAAVAAIRSGSAYVAVATVDIPTGEMRGQLARTVAAPSPSPTHPPATARPAPTATPVLSSTDASPQAPDETAPPTDTMPELVHGSPASGVPLLILLVGIAAGLASIRWTARRT